MKQVHWALVTNLFEFSEKEVPRTTNDMKVWLRDRHQGTTET